MIMGGFFGFLLGCKYFCGNKLNSWSVVKRWLKNDRLEDFLLGFELWRLKFKY
jgi:hypothetical protein